MAKKTALIRILLSLVVLMFVAATVLALGAKERLTTINGGRMTVAMTAPSIFFTADAAEEGQTQVIASTVGKRESRKRYNCCLGYTISGPDSIVGAQNWVANGFAPGFDATATLVAVGIGYAAGTNGVTLAITEDNKGVPGKTLRRWQVAGRLATFPGCCSLLRVHAQPGIPLKAGTQYWLVVRTGASTSDTWDVWNLAYESSKIGPVSSNDGSGWKAQGNGQLAAFMVRGN